MTIHSFHANQYRGAILPEGSGLSALAAAADDYRIMLGCVLEAMLDRYERRGDYHFVDTKLSLFDGRDFAADDPIRGPAVIYGWIQGRGLEALAGHEAWLRRCPQIDGSLRDGLCARVRRMMSEVLDRMEAIRASNRGRLFFSMSTEGTPLRMSQDGRMVAHELPPDAPANTTELFYVKGMAAAAQALGEEERLAEARAWYERIDRDIRDGRHASDQQPLDPANPAIGAVPGRHGHGARMLGLGAAALFLECTGDPVYQEMGLAYLDHVLRHHVNLQADGDTSRKYDMWEFVDDDGRPYLEPGGLLRSDPGHACECVGLALKLLGAGEKQGTLESVSADRINTYTEVLPAMLERNFANGFAPAGAGIVKAFDLASRRPLRSDMPWWSLPETMRAALGACRVVPADRRPRLVEIARKCSNAFLGNFVRRDLHLMAYQTIDSEAKPIKVIPATPDADPGYHTGLSVIDYLDLLEELTGAG